MAEFSDRLTLLSSQDEAGLSLEIKDGLALLLKKYPDANIRCYKFVTDYEIVIAMDLAIKRPNRALEFLKKEPVLIKLNKAFYPFEPPKAYSNRTDFPAENTPHINPVREGFPYSICLFRGDAADWFSQHTIIDFVDRLRIWMEDAAANNLNKPGDDFEYTRVDQDQHIVFFPQQDAIDAIKNHWANYSGSPGSLIASYLAKDKNPTEPETRRIAWLISIYDKSLGSADKPRILLTEDQIAGMLFFGNEDTFDERYVTQLPHDVASLISWAAHRQIDINSILNNFFASPLNLQQILPVTFAIKRPRKVINHLSELEFISFFIFPSIVNGEVKFLSSSVVGSAMLLQKNSISLARYLSGYPESPRYNEMHYVGLGAVGSKIALHFSRSGLIPKTLIDPDYSLPHNNIRNGIINFPLHKKVDKVEEDIKQLFLGNYDEPYSIKKMPHAILKVVADEPGIFDNPDQIIIDSTASFGVENFLSQKLKPTGARYARIELADAGEIGFLRVEGANRNPHMGDLMMEVYNLATTEPKISKWLTDNKTARQSHSVLDDIHLGLNCSSDTLIMPDDKVSYHTAIASIGLRSMMTDSRSYAILQISLLSPCPDQTKTIGLNIMPVNIVKAVNQPSWQLRLRSGLQEQLIAELNKNKPNETGGIFIGKIDKVNKIVYVTTIVPAPPDSKKSPYIFTRGTEGLTQAVMKIREITGEMQEYVGEWHTHPTGSAKLSPTDQYAIAEIRKVLDPIHYPTCVTVVNNARLHPYIFTKYE
jgi:proteasome lid subunit RPN8/RPN11